MKFHPRAWWADLMSYPRFLGHIWPRLSVDNPEEYRVRRKCLQGSWWPKVLQAPVGRRLLVISPHPDDEAIGAGGLLSAHRTTSEIHILCLTNGEKGGELSAKERSSRPGSARETMAATRRAELLSVARLLQAKPPVFLGLPDGAVPTDGPAVARLAAEVERIRPDVVLLPWFLDKHPDHRAANLLYARACGKRGGRVLGYEIWDPLEPNALFDITPHLERKLALIRRYRSQLRTVDYLKLATTLANFRGFYTPIRRDRTGLAEGYVAMPNREYCRLVERLLGRKT